MGSQTEQLQAEFQQQKREVQQIEQEMKGIIEQAQHSEPLLSKQLYESVRKLRSSKPGQYLQSSAELLKRGFEEPSERD